MPNQKSPVSVASINEISGSKILTYFYNGFIVEHPTRWLRYISKEPRYAQTTVEQYASNVKDFLNWLVEERKHGELSLDNILRICTRKDIQNWISNRLLKGIQQRHFSGEQQRRVPLVKTILLN